MSAGRRISRICAAAAVTAAATLGAAGSAPAATKWLCGPGVAHDPCRPSLSTTFYRGWDTRAGRSTPRRDRDRGVACFYVYPTVSNQQSRLATKHVDPEIRSIALLPGRALLAGLPRVRARVPAGDGPGAPGRQDDATRLPHGLRRRRAGLRCVPAPHRPAPRLRPHRALAGELPPATAHPPAHRQPPRAAPPAGVSRAPRRQRHRAREVGPRWRVPPSAHVQARDAALVRDRVQHVQRDAAEPVGVRPRREPRRRLPRAARRRQARDRLHEPGRPRQQPIGPVDLGRPDASRSPQGR